MGLLKEFLSGKMLVWYVAFGGIGWAVGSYLGYPIAGALIGLAFPALASLVCFLAAWLFVEMLLSLFTGNRRR